MTTVKQLIELGYGISILPEIAKSTAKYGNISYIPLSDMDANRELIVVTRHAATLNEPAKEFIRLVKECM